MNLTVPPAAVRCELCGNQLCGNPGSSGPRCARCAPLDDPRRGSPGFMGGLAAILRGFGTVIGTPRLWPYAAIPVAITVLFYLGLAAGAWAWSQSLTESLSSGGWGIFGFLKGVVAFLAPLLGVLLVFVLAFFTFTAVGTAIACPFLDILTAKVEARRLPAAKGVNESMWRGTLRSIADALRLLAVQLAVMVLALPLNLIPGIGTVLWLLIGAWLAAFDFFDFPLVRHGYPWRDRWRFLRHHYGACLGFGLGVFVSLTVPFLGLLVLPVAVAGATELYLDLRPK